MIDLYYSDYAAVSTAVTTTKERASSSPPTASRTFTGGVRVLVSDIEVPQH